MTKNQELASKVLEYVGGTSNIKNVIHCMTRLRFQLNDPAAVDLETLKATKGVLGTVNAEGTLQVIIGPHVDDVYNDLIAISGLTSHAAIEENLDEELPSKKISPRTILNGILNTFTNSMNPLVPLFVAMGMVNVVAAIIGPTVLNLVTTESALYNNFYYVGQAIIYFLPVFVAITASKHFGCNTFISVAIACMMVFPDMINALATEGGFTVYGIAAPNVTYSSQIIPILLAVLVQKYVEKLLNRIIPNSLKVVGVGFCTLAVMMPLTFCLLGPIGFWIGSALTSSVLWLYSVAGPLETTIVGSVSIFLGVFGIGRPIFFACLGVLMSTGVEYAYMPLAMVSMNFTIMGIALGYTLKVKSAEKRQLGLSCLVASALGGVSEPTSFGIILANPKSYLSVIVSGAVAGLLIGIFKVGYYQFGPSNVLAVLGYMGGEGSGNFICGCIAAVAAFAVALVMMLLTFKEASPDKK